MHEYVLAMLTAAAVTYLLTPLVRRFAIAIGAMHAARDRDVHVVPTPLLGGFAMYAGLAAALLVVSRLPTLGSVAAQTNMPKGLLLAGGLLVILGFVDDRWGMSVISKLAGQVAAGVILVWSGATVMWLPEPGGTTFSLTSDQQTVVTILLVVVTINAVNFIDGLDGLAAGIVGIGAAALFIYYYTLVHRLGLLDQAGPALASAVLVGVCLGFLPHNFHPARIFMGDTGAMLIGLLLAYVPISSLAMLAPGSLTSQAAYATGGTVNRYGEFLPLLLPAAILLIPYADLLLAVVRRTRAGMSPFAPDKKHLHHRLLAIGHSHRTSVLIMYLWAALFTGSVVWLSIVRTPLPVLAAVTVAGVLALLMVSLPRLRPWGRPAGGQGMPRAARAARAAHTPGVPGTAVTGTAVAGTAVAGTAVVVGAPAGTGTTATAATPSAAAPSAAAPPAAVTPAAPSAPAPAVASAPPAAPAPAAPAPAPVSPAPARSPGLPVAGPAGRRGPVSRGSGRAVTPAAPARRLPTPPPAGPAGPLPQPAVGRQSPPAGHQPAAGRRPALAPQSPLTREPPVSRQAGIGPETATAWLLPPRSPVGPSPAPPPGPHVLPPVQAAPLPGVPWGTVPPNAATPAASGPGGLAPRGPVPPASAPPWPPAPQPPGWPQPPVSPG